MRDPPEAFATTSGEQSGCGVIRHPSYRGLLLGLFGWALVFRSAVGVLVSLLLIPPLVARINSEEVLLESEFGEWYSDHRRRTWRLLPYLY